MNTQLKEGINWVGYIDWNVRDFHSYVTSYGATYNAYLVQDEKTALIDTVKPPYGKQLLDNIAKYTDIGKLDYIVINHAEMDHAGSLSVIVEKCPQATIVCTAKCKTILEAYNDNTADWNFKIVKSGDEISLGKKTLSFLETPMVHWPESMFTYIPEDKLLFSMDGFGQHYASINRFDDEVNLDKIMYEAEKYFANIVMLYGKNIFKVLEAAAKLEIEMIAPAHGVIWRSNLDKIINAYKEWVVCKPKPKVLVIYDTMWESTKKMGEAIVEGASIKGVEVKLIYIRASSLTDIATEVLGAAAIALGSSTLNMGMMPMMGATLTYLKGLRPANKAGFAFGSGGWGKGGAEEIDKVMSEMKIERLIEPLKCKWKPSKEVLDECREAGLLLAQRTLDVTSK